MHLAPARSHGGRAAKACAPGEVKQHRFRLVVGGVGHENGLGRKSFRRAGKGAVAQPPCLGKNIALGTKRYVDAHERQLMPVGQLLCELELAACACAQAVVDAHRLGGDVELSSQLAHAIEQSLAVGAAAGGDDIAPRRISCSRSFGRKILPQGLQDGGRWGALGHGGGKVCHPR